MVKDTTRSQQAEIASFKVFEQAAAMLGDLAVFIGGHDADLAGGTRRRNDRAILLVRFCVQLDAQKAQTLTANARTGALFSPIPPVKTTISIPPKTAAYPPMVFAMVRRKSRSPKRFRISRLGRCFESRISLGPPESAARPARWLSNFSRRSVSRPRARSR